MLESGFYFENSIGEYEISTFRRVIGFLPAMEHPEIIYRKKYLGKRTIYRPSLNQDSPLMAFANLDLTSVDAIISFCNKYGLITAEHTAEQVTNDDLYLESVKNDPLTKLQRASHEEGIGGLFMPMCDFKSAAVALKKLIELKRAISHNDIVKVLSTITYFLFDEQLKMKDKFITAVDGSKITSPDIIHSYEVPLFNQIYRNYLEKARSQEMDTDMAIRTFVADQKSRFHKMRTRSHNGFYPFAETPFIHGTWQSICELYGSLFYKFSIKSVDLMGNVVFEPELTVGGIQTTFYNLDQIYALGKAVFSDHLNTQLEDVKPVLKIINGDFTSTWSVMSLLEAMYLELFLNYTVPSKEIKQCANDNCYNYFVADNPRKIYCNSRCAWAVNKRIRRKGSRQ